MRPVRRQSAFSSLTRTVRIDGWELDVEIHRQGKKWRLEVIDERGTHNVWTELFTTEQAALDEALRAIREEGVESFSAELPYMDH
jgi:hypothetical protein